MAGYLAYIIPVDSGARPDNTLPVPPGPVDPGYSPPWATPRPPVDPGYSPPWAQAPGGGGPPLGTWGPNDPRPTPPIYIPGAPQPPLGTWGPNDPRPTPPIYIPISPPEGENGEPTHPIYIPVYPSHPIVIPPGSTPEEVYEKVKEKLEFLFGNLPTDPNPKPEPV